MKLVERILLDVPIEHMWRIITDIPTMASCIPGAQVAGSGNRYHGTIRVPLGPLTIDMEGTLTIKESNVRARRTVLDVEGVVHRAGGSMQGTVTFQLSKLPLDKTELHSSADLALQRTLAMLDNVLIKRKAKSLFKEFANNLAARARQRGGQGI